jgi:hypothetical protein
MARALTLAFVAALVACSLAFTIPRKQLGGPPAEFANHAIPSPVAAAQSSSSALFYLNLEPSTANDGSYVTKQTLSADSTTIMSFTVFSPLSEAMTLALTDPNGAAVDLSALGEASFLPNGDSEQQFPATVYTIQNPIVGNYTLITTVAGISAERFKELMSVSRSNAETHGIVIINNESNDQIFSHVASYTNSMRLEDSVGFQVNMYDASSASSRAALEAGQRPAPLKDVVFDAELEIMFPDGHIEIDAMHDDGLHNDLLANDGVFGGNFVATELGPYTVQTVLYGNNANGAFVRTAEHLLTVVANDIALTSEATATVNVKKNRLDVNLLVKDQSNGASTYRAYFELWGQGLSSNAETAIAWSSAIVNSQSTSEGTALALEVDLKWLLRAGAVGPFTLKNVYVQEINSMVPVTQAASIAVKFGCHLALNNTLGMLSAAYNGEMTEEMRFGVRPAPRNMTAAPSNAPTLVLVHGYCATQNPFQKFPEDWTDAVFFLRGGQSMTHDEFSNYVVQFAEETNGMTTYSLVGHSQGGIVSLHTLNYYWSGLDNTQSGRRIQSLASPYMGNTGSGGWAEVLKLLGGCGENYDMTKDGATLWLAGISQASMEYANYYTTRYPDGFLQNCNSVVNLVLAKPNDGTAEKVYAKLPYGNNRGETIGQCHITGMKYPASYWDHARNAEMNANAARK